MRRREAIGTSLLFVALCCAVAANAAPCRSGGPYDKWLGEFEREAMAQGISQQTIAAAAPYLTYDQRVVNIDRGQRVFTQTFLEFSDRMAAAYRIQRGSALIKTYAPVFAKIDAQFGVPAPVIVSFWALESDVGANMGNYRTLARSPRSLTTAGARIASGPNCLTHCGLSSAAICIPRTWLAHGPANSAKRK